MLPLSLNIGIAFDTLRLSKYVAFSNDKLINSESGSDIFNFIRCRISFGILLGLVALLRFRSLIESITSIGSVGVKKSYIHSYQLSTLSNRSQ